MRSLIAIVAAIVCVAIANAQFAQGTVTAPAPIFIQPGAQTPLRVLAIGTEVKVLKEDAAWTQVEFNDPQYGRRVGWVEGRLIQARPVITPPTEVATPPPTPPLRDVPAIRTEPAVTPPPTPREPTPRAATHSNTSPGRRKNVKIRGYVTEVTSPTEFEIEDYRITRDAGFVLDLENVDPSVTFNPQDIRVGVEMEIKGAFDEASGELKAASITIDMEQFKKMKQTAVIAKAPTGIVPSGAGWSGDFFVDGQHVVVSPVTQVVYKRTSREKKSAKKAEQQAGDDGEFQPVSSLAQIAVGTVVTYEGKRRVADGAILADRIEVGNNDLEEGEAKLWKSLKVSSKPAQAFTPGELKIDKVGKFKLLPNDEVQSYVSELGSRLIPSYQRDLPEGVDHKIPFRFYVIKDDSANAFALPNGIVVIHSGLIDILQNEAQLAAVVGHEIAHSVQEHSWRQMQYHKKKRLGLVLVSAVAAAYGQYDLSNLVDMVSGVIQNGHSRSLENQADRIGLEYMVAAGYDPREAPRVWKLMAKKYGLQQTNVFWSSHENQATRRSYLMNELKNNYRDLDYQSVRLNEPEFIHAQALVRNAADAKARIKVK